jgi:heme A synthase
MKGFLWLGGILKWVGIFAIFGGTFFALTDAGYQCITGYGCEDVWRTAARLFLTPQVEMSEAIDLMNAKTADGTLTEFEADSYRKQIIASILITVLLFILFTWMFTKAMTTLNATDIMFAAILGLVAIAVLQLVIGYWLNGELTIPFIGFIKLMQTPGVLISTINYSEVLPLNQTLPEGS